MIWISTFPLPVVVLQKLLFATLVVPVTTIVLGGYIVKGEGSALQPLASVNTIR